MTLTQPRQKNPLGQHFTPPQVADLMISLSAQGTDARVLEPCAGKGIFLDRLRATGYHNLTAIEVDESLIAASEHSVIHGSFVSQDFGDSFNLIIGNPPYLRHRNLDPPLRRELVESTLWNRYFTSLSDYLTIFIAKSIELLMDGGELIFVTPSFWMHTQHSSALREFMLQRGTFTHILHFGEAAVFPGVGSSIIIFRFVRQKPTEDGESICLARYQGPRKVSLPDSTYSALVARRVFEEGQIPAFRSNQPWVLANSNIQERLAVFETRCIAPHDVLGSQGSILPQSVPEPTTLGDVADIANGMVSGLDAAFRLPETTSLTKDELDSTILVAKGRHLHPYRVDELTRYIFITSRFTEKQFRSRFPNFYDHLNPLRERLEARYSYGRDLPFWEWAFLRSYSFFRNARHLILIPCKERLSNKDFLRFALAPPGCFPTQDVTGIQLKPDVREAPEYLLAFLNHPWVYDWVRHKGLMKGAVAEFSERPLSSIPVRRIDWRNSAEVTLHDKIVARTRSYITEPSEPTKLSILALLDELVGT